MARDNRVALSQMREAARRLSDLARASDLQAFEDDDVVQVAMLHLVQRPVDAASNWQRPVAAADKCIRNCRGPG